jgi:citrate lyase subunit beta-like protein
MDIKAISRASKRIDALIFASEDFCADTGISRNESLLELLYARSAVVTAAKAMGLQAIDLVCIDYKNTERLLLEVKNGKQMGFTGKVC